MSDRLDPRIDDIVTALEVLAVSEGKTDEEKADERHRLYTKLSKAVRAEVDKARREAIQKVAKSAKPPYENIKDLNGGWDRTSTYYAHQAIDQYEQNIKELLGGSSE